MCSQTADCVTCDTYKFTIFRGCYRFFFVIVFLWFGHAFSNQDVLVINGRSRFFVIPQMVIFHCHVSFRGCIFFPEMVIRCLPSTCVNKISKLDSYYCSNTYHATSYSLAFLQCVKNNFPPPKKKKCCISMLICHGKQITKHIFNTVIIWVMKRS